MFKIFEFKYLKQNINKVKRMLLIRIRRNAKERNDN